MQAKVTALVAILGLGLAGGSAAVAAPPELGSPGGALRQASSPQDLVQPVQFWGDYCERLRRRCVYKEYRGEVGEGNCRRYRAECLGSHYTYCQWLRRACIFKEFRGEVGEGNCRRYRGFCAGYYD